MQLAASAAFVLALSPSLFNGYVANICSTLEIRPCPHVYIAVTAAGPPNRAWVPAYRSDVIMIREWAVEEGDARWAHYVVAHELCHIKLRHQFMNYSSAEPKAVEEEKGRREREADNCVKKLVTPFRWSEMQDGIAVMNWLGRLRKEEKLLSSR